MTLHGVDKDVKRRLMILAVAHIGHSLDSPRIQDIMGRWAAHGDLSDSEWAEVEQLALYLGSNQYLNDVQVKAGPRAWRRG